MRARLPAKLGAAVCLLLCAWFLAPLGMGIVHIGMLWPSALLVLALALWCTLGVSAEDTTTTASGTAGSFQLEQVYVNAPSCRRRGWRPPLVTSSWTPA